MSFNVLVDIFYDLIRYQPRKAPVHGVYSMFIASDATFKGGTIYPITLQKNLRASEIAKMNNLASIHLVDSGGAFLPLQHDIFPDRRHGGRQFYNIADHSSIGLPQVSGMSFRFF